MHSNIQKNRASLNLKTNKRSSKVEHLCITCTVLKRQVRQLKELHQRLVKEIKQIATFVPREIENLVSKIKKNIPNLNLEALHNKSRPTNTSNNKSTANKNSPDPKSGYQSKLKAEDSVIKESIYKELKMIRALESKQKDLRITNEKHETLRKSISKESITSNNVTKVAKPPSSARSIEYTTPIMDKGVLRTDIHTENEWISSPKFGNSHQEILFDSNARYSSQDSKSKTTRLTNQPKPQYQILKCPSGHECFRGDTLNRIPHGNGTLMNCCNKIPFKVNPKTLKYSGSFRFGQFQGKGTLICKDNVKFQGNFSKGLRQGEGMIYLQGSGERGVWDQDKLISFI